MKIGTLNSLLFLILAVVWGLNYLWAKQALAFLDPKEIVFLRCFFATLPLALFAVAQGKLSWSHLRYWPHLLVMSALTATLYYWFFKHGIDRLDSGIAGALSGATPLVAFLGTLVFLRAETINAFKFVGLVLGVLGVVVLAQPWASGTEGRDMIGVLAVMGASLCMGASFVYARKFVNALGLPSLALATYSFGLATLTIFPFTDFGALWEHRQQEGVLLGVILGNGVFGSGLAAVIYYVLVRQWGAIPASSSTLPPPVVALVVGWLVLQEQIGLLDVGATTLIIAGVVLLRRD